MGRDHDLVSALWDLIKSRRYIFVRPVPSVIAADRCHHTLFRSDGRRLRRHAHDIIAHRPIREIIDPHETFHEEPRPRRSRVGILAKIIHRAVARELKRLGRRYV